MRIPLHCTIGAHSAAATRLLSLARSLAHLTLPDTQEGELASTPPREDVVLLMLILLAHRSGREAEHAEYVQGLPRARDLWDVWPTPSPSHAIPSASSRARSAL